jgi:integrase/recombinase XerC
MRETETPQLPILIPPAGAVPPALARLSPAHRRRFSEFFSVPIRNAHTRRAYQRAAQDFFAYMERFRLERLADIQPRHVAKWIDELEKTKSAPTVKARLAAIRHLFDWLTIGQVIPFSPAHAVRGPKHSVKRGKTPYLEADEARKLLDSIAVAAPDGTPCLRGLRDRALIGLMAYSFARISAALRMEVRDVFHERRRLWVRLHEKGGKEHVMPCHHNLEVYLSEYLEATGLGSTPGAPLFQSMPRYAAVLSGNTLSQADAFQIMRRRAGAAGIKAKIGNHSWRATGITAYLKNGGNLEAAANMANHSSTRTTQLYNRRADDVTLDEVEKIGI